MRSVSTSGRPIAWSALEKGTPVYAADGTEVGRVTEVVADEQKDIFSGVAFRSGLLESETFAPADRIDAITDEGVRLTLGAEESATLDDYER
jgi:uncharacterized protein YrrD